MTQSDPSAGPASGSVADALARTLLDTTVCPSCGASLEAPRCARCGVDLSGEAGRRVWALGHQAVLTLREREQVVAALRADAAATIAAPVAVPAPPAPPAPPALQLPAASPAPARGPAVQSLLVGLGALLLAVAGVVFLAVAWDLLGLAGRATVVAVLTAAALGSAAVLRPRLPETAEALGAIGAVLVVGDAWAARATGLAGLDAVPGLAYATVVAAVAAVLLGAFGAVTRLRSATVTAAALAPLAPVLGGLHLADAQDGGRSAVVPVVAGLLGGGLLAAGRGLLPARLGAEARVARAAAVGGTALAAFLLPFGGLTAGVTATAVGGVVVLALQAVADGRRPAWSSAWSFASGGAVVLTAVLGTLTAVTTASWPQASGAEPWARLAVAALAAALAASALLTAARWLPGSAAGGALAEPVRRWLRPARVAAGGALALAVCALPLAAGALEVLAALVRAASRPWAAAPGTTVGELFTDRAASGRPTTTPGQIALAAGLVIAGLLVVLAAGDRADDGRTGAIPGAMRRGAAAALVTGVVLLCTLPDLRVGTGTALLAVAAAAAGGLATRWRSSAIPLACAGFAVAAVLLAWTSQITSGPVTALGVLGLLVARRAARRPELRAALAGGAVLGGGFALMAPAAPLLSAAGAWADLPPSAAARLAAVFAAACSLAGVGALAVPPGFLGDWLPLERAAAAGTAAAAGLLALAVPLTGGRFTAAAVVLAGLLALAGTAAVTDPVVAGAGVGPAAAGAVPVLAAGLAASGAAGAGAGAGVRGVALAAVLAAVAVAAVLVVLALRLPGWPADRRRMPAEAGAAVAAAGGLVLGGAMSGGWLLFALTGAGLAALAVTPGRSRLADASIAPLALASGLLLAEAGVHTPEAYTLPPALALLSLGAYRLGAGGALASWPALGPGLVLGLAPSVVAAADGGPLVRVALLAVAAGAVVLAGARARLAAPVTVGAIALTAHAVVQLGPWLVALGTSVPRWTVLAAVGALLLLEGATYERQVTRLRAAAIRLASLR